MSDAMPNGSAPLPFPELQTARTRLRALTAEDAPALFRIFSDPEAMRYYDLEPFQSSSQVDELMRFFDQRLADGVGCRWGIELIASRSDLGSHSSTNAPAGLVGTIGFNRIERDRARRGVLGYDLVRQVWGRGLATEAVRAVVGHGFESLGLNRIEAYTEPGNVASERVLEKAGFTREGCLREFAYYRGAARDQICFSILARDRKSAAVESTGGP